MAKEKRSSKVDQYEGVYHVPYDRGCLSNKPYVARMTHNKKRLDLGRYETSKLAALAVDMYFIRENLPPKNVLKPVNRDKNEKDSINIPNPDKL